MFRLGIRLTLRGGKETFIRLVITSFAVAIGVTILLAVLALFHAFQVTSNRPAWEMTTASKSDTTTAANSELWNYSETIYKGQFIERLDLAALGPNAPLPPGIPHLPMSGQYYASPALAALLETTPRAELGDRFPGSPVGTIGQQALSGPNALVVYVGRTPTQLTDLPNTITVTKIATSPQVQTTTGVYRLAFGFAAIGLLFPLLILINTATRLAAAQREERYAAMRLVGATPHQINLLASVDAMVGALFGTIIGIGLFLMLQPALSHIGLSGLKFFANYVTPTPWGYGAMLVGVPLAATGASLVSLRRVRISPLGVSRKLTAPAPRFWRMLPLLLGIALFIYSVHATNTGHTAGEAGVDGGFLLILIGLLFGGSWLTMQAAKLLGRCSGGAAPLLAARRLASNPTTAFRSVSGLVLAVFLGTVVAVLAPAVKVAQSPGPNASLANTLRMSYTQGTSEATRNGLAPVAANELVANLRAYADVVVIPIYANPDFNSGQPSQSATNSADTNLVSCASLAELPALGHCAAAAKAVSANFDALLLPAAADTNTAINQDLPIVTQSNPAVPDSFTSLQLDGVLIKAANPTSLEKVRTFLTTYNTSVIANTLATGDITAWRTGNLEPETFGEIAQIRNNHATNLELSVLAVVGLTLLVAGCSLAITVGGSLVERKRPFTLLRLSGVPIYTLYQVVLLEALLPLLTASGVAAGTGYLVSGPLVNAINGTKDIRPALSATYYAVMGIGLVISVIVIVATLPLLGAITKPEGGHFE